MKRTLFALVTLALLVLSGGPAHARRYYYYGDPPWIRPKLVRGTFGLSGFGSLVARQDGGVEYIRHGGGGAMWIGVEIGRVVGIETKYAVSLHNPVVGACTPGAVFVWCDASYLLLQTLSLDLKLHIPTNSRFVPYFEVGPMLGFIGRSRAPADAIGGGFEIGGGFDVWFTRHGTLGFEVLYRGLRMADYATYTGTATYLSFVQLGGTLAAHF